MTPIPSKTGSPTVKGTWTPIDDELERRDWLWEMVRFQDQAGTRAWRWEETLRFLTMDMPAKWWLLELKEPIDAAFANLWAEQQGEWRHKSYRGPHETLGMAYAWWARQNSGLRELTLGDSPDLSAKCGDRRAAGDIGHCSPLAFWEGLRRLEFHSVWISVLDEATQVLLELLYHSGRFITCDVQYKLGASIDRDEAIRRSFWCSHCKQWAVSERFRDSLWGPRDKSEVIDVATPDIRRAPAPRPRKRRMGRIL